jgi:peptide/nickel transport system substrate-binding protein
LEPATAFYGQPVYGGTLRINYEDPLEHANVWGARTGAAMRYRVPTTSALIQDNPYDPTGPFIPDLAYGWTIHDDLQGVTFFLREEVEWHNGADFTCEDARFSFESMVTGEGVTASYMQNRMADVDPGLIECIDDLTLEFRFTAPSASPILNFGKTEAMVFNKEWFLAGGEKDMFQDASVGTGPFIWAEGQTVGVDEQHFEKNPDYFIEELPYVDELVVFGILDESAQQAAMLGHQTDWHWVRNFGQYEQYVTHDQIMTVIRATRSSENLWMNLRKPPFDNMRVRQAIAMGMDRKAGIAVAQSGYGSEGLGLMPPAASGQ